jgi:hypothetical protein
MLSLKRVFYAFLLIGLLLSSLAVLPVSALTDCAPGPHTVSGSQNVNARLGSSTNARILRTLAPGTVVTVTGQELGTIVGSNGVWCAISLDGQTVYVHSAALVASAGSAAAGSNAPASAGGSSYRVAGSTGINGRATASTSGRIVVVIPGGADVTVVGTVSGSIVNGSGTWYEVVYNGQNVFVHGSLLVPNSGQSVSQPAIVNPPASPQQPTGSGIPAPVNGIWTITLDGTSNLSCEGTGNVAFPTTEIDPVLSFPGRLAVSADRTYFSIDGDPFVLQGADTYVGSYTFGADLNGQVYLNIQSPTFISGHLTSNFTVDNVPCSVSINLSMTKA